MSFFAASGTGIRQPPPETWPPSIIFAWRNAIGSRRGRLLSTATIKTYGESVGAFVWYLEDLLDAEVSLTDLATPENMDGYFDYLQHQGNAPYSILGRFGSLHAALRMMYPDGDFGCVTKLDGVPIRQLLEMRRRILFVPDSRHNVFWAEELFRDALVLPAALPRRLQIRDAAIIGIFAELAPRARAMRSFRLCHLHHNGEEWILRQEGPIMKRQQTVLELPLSPRVGAILDQYIRVERRELLGGRDHDALWVAKNGRPLGESGVKLMIAARSKKHYGVSFGPQRFRISLTTTRAMVGGGHPFDTSLILGHAVTTSLRNYNRANAIEATRAQDGRIDALEDG
jgi:integrase